MYEWSGAEAIEALARVTNTKIQTFYGGSPTDATHQCLNHTFNAKCPNQLVMKIFLTSTLKKSNKIFKSNGWHFNHYVLLVPFGSDHSSSSADDTTSEDGSRSPQYIDLVDFSVSSASGHSDSDEIPPVEQMKATCTAIKVSPSEKAGVDESEDVLLRQEDSDSTTDDNDGNEDSPVSSNNDGDSESDEEDASYIDYDQAVHTLIKEKNPLSILPSKDKSNSLFVIDNKINDKRRKNQQNNRFKDNCGAYLKPSCSKRILEVNESGIWAISSNLKFDAKTNTFSEGQQQVDVSNRDVIVFRQSYYRLKRKLDFGRRITVVLHAPKKYKFLLKRALVEYKGKQAKKAAPHGRSKKVVFSIFTQNLSLNI